MIWILLFLDEPTVGLDPDARRNLLDLLKDRVRDGLTIFYTTHVLSEVEYLCDRVAIIKNGRILASGTPQELKEPQAPEGHHNTYQRRPQHIRHIAQRTKLQPASGYGHHNHTRR